VVEISKIDETSIRELPRKFKRVTIDRTLKKLIVCKVDFLLRKGSECNELIYDNNHRVYASRNGNFPAKKVFLFNSVQNDVRSFLENSPFIVLPPAKKTTEYNLFYDDSKGTITGTDLDHAFWRIAYVKGYIRKKTYNYGLDDNAKALRLATLSVLGREKKYDRYIQGEFIDTVILKRKDEKMQQVFKDIRTSCYYMMYELSVLLGDDFDCWKTDCIYYRDTPENRKIVHDYFDERNMLWKQLVFNTMDAFMKVA
jgi:hypothetical protein